MSGSGACRDEMYSVPFLGRRDDELGELLPGMIFDRRPLPPEAPPEMHDLARMIAAVAGPAEPAELAGEATALAAFARLASPAGISPAALRPARRRLSGRPARARLPMAAALVTAAAGLGSIAAAYVGVLPGPIQQMAHVTVGAPVPQPGKSLHPPAVTDVEPGASRDPATSAAKPTYSAAPAPVSSSVSSNQLHCDRSGRALCYVVPTCTPSPSPSRTLATPGPVQSPLEPGWTPWSADTPGCPG